MPTNKPQLKITDPPAKVPTPATPALAASAVDESTAALLNQTPAIPLTQERHDAYLALYAKLQEQLKSTNDGNAMTTLMDTSDEVKSILDTNDSDGFKNNTGAFAGLLTKVKATNTDLAALKDNIAAIAGYISDADGVIAAIQKVVDLVG